MIISTKFCRFPGKEQESPIWWQPFFAVLNWKVMQNEEHAQVS